MGIIGYGGMAYWHHENSKRVENFEVVAAHDIDPKRLEYAESRGLKPYAKLGDFLADQSFDLVLVAVPNNFHHDMVIAALEAGKNVICEKPVALSVAELDEMIATSRRVGKFFSVHQNRRWDEDFNIVKTSIEQGLLGKPYTIESRVHGQNGVMEGWRAYKVAGGGMVYDWGIHILDQVMWMIKSKVTEVYANLFSVKTPEVDDYFKAILRFESGEVAQLEVGTYNLIQGPRWYVCGDGGALIIEGWDCKGHIEHAKDRQMEWTPEVVQTKAGPTRSMAPRPKETLVELPLPKVQTDWADYYRNVFDVIRNDEQAIVTHDEQRRLLKVIEAIFESGETGQVVAVE